VAVQIHARLDDADAFAFEELSLQGTVRLANEDFAVFTDNAMPGNAFTGGSRRHGASGTARASREAQYFRQYPIS
jgi:hypothetical protein